MSENLEFPINTPDGKKVIGFAPQDRIDKYFGTDVYNIFCREVLEFEPDEILLTDESSITDFPEERKHYINKTKEVFNVEVSDLKRWFIVDILDRIVASRKSKY